MCLDTSFGVGEGAAFLLPACVTFQDYLVGPCVIQDAEADGPSPVEKKTID